MVEGILGDFGVVGCLRVRNWENQSFQTGEGVPHQVEGSQSLQGANLPEGVPAYHQWKLEVPADVVVRLSWTMTGGGFFGGEPSPLSLAVRQGEAIAVNGFTGGFMADALIDAPEVSANYTQTVELSGACLPAGGGDLYLMFRNEGQGSSGVISTGVGFFDDVSGNHPVATCD